jgi:hypothetical protein
MVLGGALSPGKARRFQNLEEKVTAYEDMEQAIEGQERKRAVDRTVYRKPHDPLQMRIPQGLAKFRLHIIEPQKIGPSLQTHGRSSAGRLLLSGPKESVDSSCGNRRKFEMSCKSGLTGEAGEVLEGIGPRDEGHESVSMGCVSLDGGGLKDLICGVFVEGIGLGLMGLQGGKPMEEMKRGDGRSDRGIHGLLDRQKKGKVAL